MEEKIFLETLVRQLVSCPDDVEITRTQDERGVLLYLKVNPVDAGRIIGKRGRAAQALRVILKIFGGANMSFINLRIHDPRREAIDGQDTNQSLGI